MASLITQVNSTQATTTTWVEEGPKDPFVDDPYWDENGKSKPSNPLNDVLVQLQVAQARVGGGRCRLQVRHPVRGEVLAVRYPGQEGGVVDA
jgi:hypothetical protein